MSGAVVNVALNLVLIPRYGGMGAAVATVISYAVAGLFACFLYRPTWRNGWMMVKALLVPFRACADGEVSGRVTRRDEWRRRIEEIAGIRQSLIASPRSSPRPPW